MGATTLAVGVLCCLAIMAMKPRHGLGVFFGLMMTYPTYLAFSVGTIDITAARIVICVLILRALVDQNLVARYRFSLMDGLVIALFLWGVVVLSITVGAGILENRAGVLMNTVLPYFAARLIITDRKSLCDFAKWVTAIVIPVAGLAVIESGTGWSPYAVLKQYSFLSGAFMMPELRWGFTRAGGPSGAIIFGLCFVSAFPMILALRKCADSWRRLSIAACVAATCGVIASMSSGPFMCMVVFTGCMALIYRPTFVKPLVVLFLLSLLAAEVGSNRHFYDLIGYLTFSRDTAWYRARLIERAIEKLPEYWLLGYGPIDPGWGPSLDGRKYTDVCNGYVLFAVTQGLPGALLFGGILAAAMMRLKNAYRRTLSILVKHAAWYFGCFLVGLMAALWSVGLLGTMETLFYIMAGIVAAPVFDVNTRWLAMVSLAAQSGGNAPEGAHASRNIGQSL